MNQKYKMVPAEYKCKYCKPNKCWHSYMAKAVLRKTGDYKVIKLKSCCKPCELNQLKVYHKRMRRVK